MIVWEKGSEAVEWQGHVGVVVWSNDLKKEEWLRMISERRLGIRQVEYRLEWKILCCVWARTISF